MGGPLQDQKVLAKSANPITYVDKRDPPFLIVHGDQDPLVPHLQSQLLHDALLNKGVPSELIIVPGGGHGSFRSPVQLSKVKKFFKETLAAGSNLSP